MAQVDARELAAQAWLAAAGVADEALAEAIRCLPTDLLMSWSRGLSPVVLFPSASTVAPASVDPVLLLHCLHAAAIRPGDQVLLIGDAGPLASALTAALAGQPAVVREDRFSEDEAAEADVLFLQSGCSRVPWPWLRRLRPGGRALFALLGSSETAVYFCAQSPTTGRRWRAHSLALADAPRSPSYWEANEAALLDALAHRLLEVRSLLPAADDGLDMVIVEDEGCLSVREGSAP